VGLKIPLWGVRERPVDGTRAWNDGACLFRAEPDDQGDLRPQRVLQGLGSAVGDVDAVLRITAIASARTCDLGSVPAERARHPCGGAALKSASAI
jgi:hypothetical protein